MVKTLKAEAVQVLCNRIGDRETTAAETFLKISPHDGQTLYQVPRSGVTEIDEAVQAARQAQPSWAAIPPVKRGEILAAAALHLRANRDLLARTVSLETGKSVKAALGETDAAIALGMFYAGEGQRLFGRTIASGIENRQVSTIRQPRGVAGLIVAANTPIANVAWKVFPALICGNAAVLKSAEDTPATAWLFVKLAVEAGLPSGVLNLVHGYGPEAGAALSAHPGVDVLSFTGSSETGRKVAVKAAENFCRLSLECGGKNAFVVCDDADVEAAASWAALSAFSNAGQRCAAAGRILVYDKIYDAFKTIFLETVGRLRLGTEDEDDLGPLIHERQLKKVLDIVERAVTRGAVLLAGGKRLTDAAHQKGFYAAPTVVENVPPADEIAVMELFAPVAVLFRVKDLEQAIRMTNDSGYGLTAAIHTRDLNRAHTFAARVQAGVVSINGGTYGSEPHLPFGGFKSSGNGTREPGTEALDIYSELKNIYLNVNPSKV